MIEGVWDRHDKAIIDSKLGDAGADSYRYEPMVAIISWW